MDILEAAELAGITIVGQRGAEHLAHCTVHDDQNPSVSINTEKDAWVCYGCGKGGHGAESFLRYFAPDLAVYIAVPVVKAQEPPGTEAAAARLFLATASRAAHQDFTPVDRAVIAGEFVRVRALCLRLLSGTDLPGMCGAAGVGA